MAKVVKNIDTVSHIYAGQTIEPSEFYSIQSSEDFRWANDDNLLVDIVNSKAKMNDGIQDIEGISSQINFLKNFASSPKDASGFPVRKIQAFADASGFRARFKGFSGIATKASDSETPTISNIDMLFSEERYMNGVQIILKNHFENDEITFQVVDKDGAGVNLGWYTQQQFDAMGNLYVVDTFGESWQISDSKQDQNHIVLPYPAKVYSGLYVRLKYTSTGTVNDVKVKVNLHLHKKTI